ncbi:methyl-accepting chemotaxis protein [Vibrio coralliilyticus]|uniref:methyl-accepting chemotaxis protein n=1 Tax=Vibrio coralliilyticus TaxID=190893 RepID=UPI0017A2BBAB|nr:methyl-accepting chemotaxis protein [Vibrio coralliilyticus]NUW68035.1 methyl-accepting chemotaxis protein [Vibrio coralliilyticus]
MVQKISLSFLFVMICLSVGALLVTDQYLEQWRQKNIQINNDEVVSVVSRTFESNLVDTKSMIQQFAFLLPYYGKENPVDDARLLRVLNRVHAANLAFIDVYFADIDGIPFSALSEGWVRDFNVIQMQREWYLAISQKGYDSYVSEPYVSNTGERVISVSAPIKRQGELVGVFGVDVTLSELMPDFGVEFAITTKDGEIVMADEATRKLGWINKDIYELRPEYNDLSSAPFYYMDNEVPYTVSKQPLNETYDLFAWTNQTNADEMNNSLVVGVVLLFVIVGLILMLAVFWVVRRELRMLPTMVCILEDMSKGDFKSFDFDKSNNELDKIKQSLQTLQKSVADIVQGSDEKMNALTEQQSRIEHLIEETTINANQGFRDVEQVSTAACELSSTASEVSNSAAHADKMAKATMDVVNSGANVLGQTSRINSDVSNAMSEAANIVNELRGHSEQINSVIEVINSISEQTNLLALNAAIEAARAGEQGRGFAVVADEVRSLAKRTQSSTVDIQNIITQLQSQSQKADEYMVSNTKLVQESQMMMGELSESFAAIREQVTQISEMNTAVSTASGEQSSVTQDINQRIEGINETVRSNVDSAEKTQVANTVISEQTAQLKQVLSFFKLGT